MKEGSYELAQVGLGFAYRPCSDDDLRSLNRPVDPVADQLLGMLCVAVLTCPQLPTIVAGGLDWVIEAPLLLAVDSLALHGGSLRDQLLPMTPKFELRLRIAAAVIAMEPGFTAFLCTLLVVQELPVYALDCSKTLSQVERLFCANPELKQADEAMSAAYFKLLRATTDPDCHEALIRSQRRWLQVREDGPDTFGRARRESADSRKILFEVTNDRIAFLQSGEPIIRMQLQRQLRAQDSDGAYAGYKAYCVLQPPPYGNWDYECWGETRRQQNERFCSSVMEWASGQMTDHRAVSVLRDGKPLVVAACSTGHVANDEQCPLPGGDVWNKLDARWNTAPANSEFLPAWDTVDIWKYDPDVALYATDPEWMQDCLFAPTYPPAPGVDRPEPSH